MRARRIVVTAGLIAAIVLLMPGEAFAASGSCLSRTATVNGSDAVHIPPLTGVGFSCLVDGMRPYARGLVQQLLPLAKMLLALALLAELAWCGLFGGTDALNRIGRAFMRALLTTVLLEMYPAVTGGLESVAVDGSNGALEMMQQISRQAGRSPVAPQTPAARSMVQQQADMAWAQRASMEERSRRDPGSVDRAELESLRRATDASACRRDAERERARSAPDAYATRVAVCDEIEARAATGQGFREAAHDLGWSLNPLDWLRAATGGVLNLVSLVGEFFLSATTLAVGMVLAMLFTILCAVGPIPISLLANHKSAPFFSKWFKAICGVALLPVIQSLCIGMYYGGVDTLVSDGAPLVGIAGLLALQVATIIAMIAGFSFTASFSGGALGVVTTMSKTAIGAGLGVAASGLGAAYAGYQSAGGGLRGVASGAKQGMKGAGAAAGRYAAQSQAAAAGKIAGAATGDPSGEVSKAVTGVVAGVGSYIGHAAARKASDVKAAVRERTGARRLEEPVGGSPTNTERAWAAAHAGNGLAGMLSAVDRSIGEGGRIELSEGGRRKVAMFRQANRERLRGFQNLTDAEFVNADGIRGRLAGSHQSAAADLTGAAEGTVEHAIAERLAPALTPLIPPGMDRDTCKRFVDGVVAGVRGNSKESWTTLEAEIKKTAGLARRSAVGSDGHRYGINPDHVSPSVKPAQRQYTAEPGSRYHHLHAAYSSRLSADEIYNMCRDNTMHEVKQADGEGDDAYMDRVNARVFTVAG